MANPKPLAFLLGAIVLLVVLLPGGGAIYYSSEGGEACARCHEIRPSFDVWSNSTHRSIPCSGCHGGLFTPDVNFHINNLGQLIRHVRGDVPGQVVLTEWRDLERVTRKCQECHQQEYAAWRRGPHSATYADIFLDTEHNTKRLLTDDCLRCHGMHFTGSVEDLVTPIATRGPWKLKMPELADKPTIPCVACHEMHRKGTPLGPRLDRKNTPAAATQEITRPSLTLFDRRTKIHLPLEMMPLPIVFEGERMVKMSPDRKQALCYQCHAPEASAQAGSGDDRTGLGVHEGLSCLACHQAHSQNSRASCAGCHPRWSNCGLDVETMDTTFKDPKSKHNVHTVKCADCHPKGIPPKRKGVAAGLRPAVVVD